MEFRHLEAFLLAAREGSFTRAAELLHLTQSAVSQLIRSLEEEVGEALFLRTNRAVKLTEAGRQLLPTAEEVLRARRQIIDRSNPAAGSLSGRLRVGTSAAASAYLWAAIYQAFVTAHPQVELDIRTVARTQDTIDQLLNGDLDLGFAPVPVTTPRLTGHPLGVQSALLVAAPTHPLSLRRRLTLEEVGRARFILYEPQISFRTLADQFFERLGLAPEVVLQSNDTHLIRAMVEVGFGVALLPDWAVQRELRERRLKVLRPMRPELRQAFGIVHPQQAISPAARAFVAFCTAHRGLLPRTALI